MASPKILISFTDKCLVPASLDKADPANDSQIISINGMELSVCSLANLRSMEIVAGGLVRLCLFVFSVDGNDGGLWVVSSGLLLLSPVVEAAGLIDGGTVAIVTFGCNFFPFGWSILCGSTQIPRPVLDFVAESQQHQSWNLFELTRSAWNYCTSRLWNVSMRLIEKEVTFIEF